MRRFGVNVTLDPATAHPQLLLSADGKQVVCAESLQNVPPSKERFDTELWVLAQKKLTHGYFEVLVQGCRDWTVGVVPELMDRSGPLNCTAADLFLALQMRNGNCYATEYGTLVQLREDIQRIGVFVGYGGEVSFYDVDDSRVALLYSFTEYYVNETATLLPVFSPGSGDVPMIILPTWDVEFRPLLTYEVKSDKIKVENFLTGKYLKDKMVL
ncbi:probable E3 ubiquitin-protein ligase TRIML1 [Engraulis encrasicolus]|uniref:probable E3 ubiquitin-protein ligase TRIML1 n=1 Tax=Engraulis encrasicolus TaxID=184585 RepID=UPI002FD31019